MPFYTWLRADKGDSQDELKMKLRSTQKIKDLRASLQAHIEAAEIAEDVEPPSDSSKLIRIATWNIREFDSSSYGYRSQESKAYIAEILSHFDLIALQEIRRDLDALEDVRRPIPVSFPIVQVFSISLTQSIALMKKIFIVPRCLNLDPMNSTVVMLVGVPTRCQITCPCG